MSTVLFVAVGIVATFSVFAVGAMWGFSLGRHARRITHRPGEHD